MTIKSIFDPPFERLNKEIKDRAFPKNKQQAIKSSSNFLKITAGAGAGKTTTLAFKIAYLLCTGVKPKEIVAFTFTEKAAANMKNKIFQLVEKIKPELYNYLGEMYIGTMHGFCFQALQDYFGYGNYDVLEDNKEVAFILNEGWSFGFGNEGNYTQNCLRFLHSMAVVYEERINSKILEKEAYGFNERLKKYESLLNDHKLLTFAQMTSLLVDKIRMESSPLRYIKHLIVDEYQDINKAQQELISTIGTWANVYAVGDPRQCIYQWRGSDKSFFDKFNTLFPNVESVDIPENFRSGSEIVEKANLFANTLKDKYTPMSPIKLDKGKVIKLSFETAQDEAETISEKIRSLIERKTCEYSVICMLLRSVKTAG